MNDCPNADIRDLLCNAVHDTLAADDRRRVDAHVASCADCTAELALLHRAREVLKRGTPQVDANRIAAAIPVRRTRSWGASVPAWRIAATIAVMAVGAASLSRTRGGIAPDGGRAGGESAVGTVAAANDPHTLSFSGRLSSLDDEDLAQLLSEIDDLDGGTPAEPAVVLPVPGWEGGTP